MFRRFCGLQFHCLVLATRPWRIIQCIITLFTVSFSHLHNNVIQRGCDALMLKLQNSPKLPRLHTGFYYYANEQVNHEKRYSDVSCLQILTSYFF